MHDESGTSYTIEAWDSFFGGWCAARDGIESLADAEAMVAESRADDLAEGYDPHYRIVTVTIQHVC